MQTELDRSMQKLKTQPVPPYFLSYEIVDTHTTPSLAPSEDSRAAAKTITASSTLKCA